MAFQKKVYADVTAHLVRFRVVQQRLHGEDGGAVGGQHLNFVNLAAVFIQLSCEKMVHFRIISMWRKFERGLKLARSGMPILSDAAR